MTWDYSSNVQIPESDLHFLAAYHNGTIHFHRLKGMQKGKKYLLEISPDYMNREQGSARDAVDGRWIDLGTGLYMNLTAVRYNPDHASGEGMLYTKNGQEFHVCEWRKPAKTMKQHLMLHRTLCYIRYEIRPSKACPRRSHFDIRKF